MHLTDRERTIIDLAGRRYRYAGTRDQAIRDELGVSAHRFFQELGGLLERPEALAYAPLTVRRLARLGDQRARARSMRSA